MSKLNPRRRPTLEVTAIGQMDFSGHLIPDEWYKHIKLNGKTYLPATVILADVVYWYRPKVVEDADSGVVIGWERKFNGDKLQRSVGQLVDKFGITDKQARTGLNVLRELGVLETETRVVTIGGVRHGNVLFMWPIVEKLREITYPPFALEDEGRGVEDEGRGVEDEGRGVEDGRIQRITTKTLPKTTTETLPKTASSSSVEPDRVDADHDREEEDGIDSHSHQQPANEQTAGSASPRQKSTLAELTPQPDPTARPQNQVSSDSHSDSQPQITGTVGLASLDQNRASSDLQSDARDGGEPNPDPTAVQGDAALGSLCEDTDGVLNAICDLYCRRFPEEEENTALFGWLREKLETHGSDLMVACIEATFMRPPVEDGKRSSVRGYLHTTLIDRQQRLDRLAVQLEQMATVPLVAAATPVDDTAKLKELAIIKGATHLMATDNADEWALYGLSHHEPPLVLVGYVYANGKVPRPDQVSLNREPGLARIPEGAIEL